ncbi:SDR family NAD(P)-dependent oxidoreductase [Gillisia limnaea]|uniref:Short-chain dehydrogenase/reductase SDR n=1 Tax=Gillisia limnaea (strain DSM 15749 / LMG 21470 / R-8282) TaxID=865937 RepID=H2BSX0_GILLR|nr:SDR family oxidoreductase [Gillisia limnaea]EHQ01500.1 short-chain dehydrogenase/reductase SDR [Gillisia limnaea DSM 15749]
MGRLEGKVALITGSDSGIGRATAVEFAIEGARVVVTYNSDEEGAKEALKEIESAGSSGIILQVDVSEEKEVENMFDKAIEEFGTVDILLNNAAVNGKGYRVEDMPTEVWDQAIKVNLYGYFYCIRRFVQIRKNSKEVKGKIINISSVHEEIAAPGTAEYCSSKGAVKMLMRTLALELAEDGINVNNIAPGMILTPMNQEAKDDKEERQKKIQNIPMKRAGTPEEVGKLAVFLASSDSDYITGSTYVVDGGLMRLLGQGA